MTTVRDISKIVTVDTTVKIINHSEFVYAEYMPGEIIGKEHRDLEIDSIYIENGSLVLCVRDKEEDILDAKPIEKYII